MPDQIWADEGGVMVRFERATNDGVTIQIREVSGREQRVLAEATLGNWRWDRAVSAMATEQATGQPSSPLAHVADALRLKADLEAERDHWRERAEKAEAALAAAERAVWEKVIKARCVKCRNGVGFVTNEHGVLRPRGHVATGIVGDRAEWCQANWEHDQLRALATPPGAPEGGA